MAAAQAAVVVLGGNPKKQEIAQLIKSKLEQASLVVADGSSAAISKQSASEKEEDAKTGPEQQQGLSSESTEVLGGITKSDASAVVLIVTSPSNAEKPSAEQLALMHESIQKALHDCEFDGKKLGDDEYACFPLHNVDEASQLVWGGCKVDMVKNYFGIQVAWYYAWLGFYTKALVLPSVLGVLLYWVQWQTHSFDSVWVPPFCTFMAIWCTMYLEFWRRRSATLAQDWAVTDHDEEIEAKALEKVHTQWTELRRFGRVAVSWMVTGAVLAAVVAIMLFFIWLEDNKKAVYAKLMWQGWPQWLLGSTTFEDHGGFTAYCVIVVSCGQWYTRLGMWLNNWEDHPTQVEKEHHLIVKLMCFQFFNYFSYFFYIAFWLQDMERLHDALLDWMIVKTIVWQLVESLTPMATYIIKRGRQKPGNPAVREFSRAPYDDIELFFDYLEIVFQFGYVTMFAVAFPLGPMCALVNNVLERYLDGFKMVYEHRRPWPQLRSDIGPWYWVMEFTAFAAVLTNCALMGLISDQMHLWLPTSLNTLKVDCKKLLGLIVVEHALFALKGVLAAIIPDEPMDVRLKRYQELSDKRKAKDKGAPAFGEAS